MMLTATPLPRKLDSVGVAELVRSEPAPDARGGGEVTELGARGGGRPRPAAGGSVDHAQQRTDRQRDAVRQPRVELLKAPLVHPGLASLIALAMADQQRASALVDVGLAQRERFRDPQATAPQDRDQRTDPEAVAVTAGLAHDLHDLLRPRWIGRILHSLVAGRATGQKPGGRDGRPPPTAASTRINDPDMTCSSQRMSAQPTRAR